MHGGRAIDAEGLEKGSEATTKKRSSVHPQGTLLMSKKGKKTSKSEKAPPAKTSPGSLGQGCVNRC